MAAVWRLLKVEWQGRVEAIWPMDGSIGRLQ
jgi:hypothetical protein